MAEISCQDLCDIADKHVAVVVPWIEQTHSKNSREALVGRGADRHLFGLMIQSRLNGGQVPEMFQTEAYQQGFELSTSQTACRLSMAGGFGPTSFSGYGVSYFVQEEGITFTITSFKGGADPEAKAFYNAIWQAMQDMKDMLQG